MSNDEYEARKTANYAKAKQEILLVRPDAEVWRSGDAAIFRLDPSGPTFCVSNVKMLVDGPDGIPALVAEVLSYAERSAA